MSDPYTYQEYLLNTQYKDDKNLLARMELHRLFSTNPYNFHRWVFDHFVIPEQARVLELGCGPGYLWRKNLDRIPTGWQITLSDFSPGMLEQARANLRQSSHPFAFARIDAQSIPYEDAYFDGVIANHMLYHVPDIPRALAAIRRVLKPGGRFYAVTNGLDHMHEIKELFSLFDPAGGRLWTKSFSISPFRLENGAELIGKYFDLVNMHIYEDGLLVTEAEPLAAYVFSTQAGISTDTENIARFTASIEEEIDRQGAIRITKSTGMFEAY